MLPREGYRFTGRIGAGRRRCAYCWGCYRYRQGRYWNGRIVTDPANFFATPVLILRKSHNCLAIRSENMLLASTSGRISQGDGDSSVCKGCGGYASGFGNFGGTEGRATLRRQQHGGGSAMFVRQPELLVFDDLSALWMSRLNKVVGAPLCGR